MSEKHYISENAQLMAEWDWEKNNPLGLSPNELVMGCGKKLGGNVLQGTSGRHQLRTEQSVIQVAHIVQDAKQYLELTI